MKTKKDDKQVESWFKASAFAEMVVGSRSFPGGAAAWVPTLVMVVGAAKLEQKDKVRRSLGARCSTCPFVFNQLPVINWGHDSLRPRACGRRKLRCASSVIGISPQAFRADDARDLRPVSGEDAAPHFERLRRVQEVARAFR